VVAGLIVPAMAAVLGLIAIGVAAPQPSATVPLPSDLRLDPPAPDVPARIARFARAWTHGAWGAIFPHVPVVGAVDAAGRVQVVYALGDSAEGSVRRGDRRVTERIDGDALAHDLSDRAALANLARVPAVAPDVVPPTVVRIPLTEAGPGGKLLTLEATLYRPAADGSHPVLLFNHGSTGGGAVAAKATMRPTGQAPFFVERGFAVLAPMRRGRGASEGEAAEWEGACSPENLSPGLARAIEDVDAAMAYLRAQPWADPTRVLITGQSRGGILSVAYAAERPGAVRAVINFAGGWTSDGCDRHSEGFNEPTFAAAGRRARLPMLWLYAEGDRYYSPASIRRYHEAFAQAGGTATLRLFPDFGSDGHRLVDRVDLWAPVVDEFLRRLSLSPR
jgi:dienelactone hydrolase